MQILDVTRGNDNYFEDNSKIEAVCLHGTAGSLQASLAWLRNPRPDNPGAAVSANYVVAKSGLAYMLVNWQLGRRAWANGAVENYDQSIKWLVHAVKNKINPNLVTVSIEHEASSVEMIGRKPMTDLQFNTSIDLVASILKAAGLPANHQTIIGHNQISGERKYNCPGVIFPPAYNEVLLLRYPELAY